MAVGTSLIVNDLITNGSQGIESYTGFIIISGTVLAFFIKEK